MQKLKKNTYFLPITRNVPIFTLLCIIILKKLCALTFGYFPKIYLLLIQALRLFLFKNLRKLNTFDRIAFASLCYKMKRFRKYKNYFKCVRNIFLINVYATQVNATLNSIDCCCTIVYKYYYYQLWRSIRTSARTYATLLIKSYMYTMLYYRWTVAQTRNTVYAEHRPLWLLWTEETELGRRCWLIKEKSHDAIKAPHQPIDRLSAGVYHCYYCCYCCCDRVIL